MKGRLFWLPMWLIGLGGTGYFSYQQWGWIGPVGIVIIGAGVFVGLLLLGRAVERKDWEKAPAALSDLRRLADGTAQSEELWKTVKTAFFVPSSMKYTVEVCQHNLAVIDYLDQLVDDGTAGKKAIHDYRVTVTPGLEPLEKPIKVSNEIEEGITKIIDGRLEYFQSLDKAE